MHMHKSYIQFVLLVAKTEKVLQKIDLKLVKTDNLIVWAIFYTPNQVALFDPDSDNNMQWREVGHLPYATYGLQAAVIDNIIFVTGGFNQLNSILAWDPDYEWWYEDGKLSVGRYNHAAVAIPLAIIQSGCS